jgi:alkanesulfonate monooxygenase SsuD/methylene tetrahydromethanopterin reductase-like flavin-dependent oxidoreductase (luciferase family)
MRIGVMGGVTAEGSGTIDDVVRQAQAFEASGLATFWLPNIFGLDAITTLALVGRETKTIELGTAVVPTYPRHPVAIAQQALTAGAAANGRFTLGLGLSHKIVIEDLMGGGGLPPARL